MGLSGTSGQTFPMLITGPRSPCAETAAAAGTVHCGLKDSAVNRSKEASTVYSRRAPRQ